MDELIFCVSKILLASALPPIEKVSQKFLPYPLPLFFLFYCIFPKRPIKRALFSINECFGPEEAKSA